MTVYSTSAPSLRRAGTTLCLVLALAGAAMADDDVRQLAEKEIAFGVDIAPMGLWQEALYRWQRAVRLDPENVKAQNNLGVAYEQRGELELAEEHYKKALELAPDNVYVRQNYELFKEANENRTRESDH